MDNGNILFGSASALLVLTFLVQTLRETFDVDGKYLPILGFGLAMVMMVANAYLPNKLIEAIALACLLAAAASAGVRYVKNGEEAHAAQRSRNQSLQGSDADHPGSGRPKRARAKTPRQPRGSTGLRDQQHTEPLPHPDQIIINGGNPDG